MDTETKELLSQILAALQDIAAALKDPSTDNNLQQITKLLGQIAQNGAP